ncbi:hypothetical protein KP509_28G018300 [Ceratopteris richardii]|uniref:Glycosyltransferase n=1 Tax=Ceratopteris richardii TaxID=49495 RepID=A0A8T2RBS7_CERRI|nr:hypothetical protein KP509_28G018300 [Ceratopteris richardii]
MDCGMTADRVIVPLDTQVKQRHHAVAIPLTTQGHLNTLMRFCRALADEGFTITFVNTDFVQKRVENESKAASDLLYVKEDEKCTKQQTEDVSYNEATTNTGCSEQDMKCQKSNKEGAEDVSHNEAIAPADTSCSKLMNENDVTSAEQIVGVPASAEGEKSTEEEAEGVSHNETIAPVNNACSKQINETDAPSEKQLNGVPASTTTDLADGDTRKQNEDGCRDGCKQKTQGEVRVVHIPVAGLDLDNDFRFTLEEMFTALDREMPLPLEQLLTDLMRCDDGRPRPTCIISDITMVRSAQRLSKRFNLPYISFYPASATSLLLTLHVLQGSSVSLPQVLEALKQRERGQVEVFCEGLTGLPRVLHNTDLFHFKHMVDENEFVWKKYTVDVLEETLKASHAIAVNSVIDIEGAALNALSDLCSVKVYGVGPLVDEIPDDSGTQLWKEDSACMDWLEQQPPRSVLYISFGSYVLLPRVQFDEFAAGLLASRQRFLWVFRPDLIEGCPFSTFPTELLSQAEGRGIAVRWAPQVRVLAHPSIGGFLTHCGWNSTLEALTHGVPMLCWPYFADQFLDAKHVIDVLEVALRFQACIAENDDYNGNDAQKQHCKLLVKRNEVEKVIRALMEGEIGEVLHQRAKTLKEACRLSCLEGGNGRLEIQSLIQSLVVSHSMSTGATNPCQCV